MESHPKSAAVHRQPSLLPLLCLIVFLPYLLLPAVYYGHLTAAFLPPFQEDPRAGPLAIGTHPEKPPEPYHDSGSCPVCRAASSFHDYGCFPWTQAQEGPTPVWLVAVISPAPIIANPDFLVSGPRAPPVFL